jgi:hypothetical protein
VQRAEDMADAVNQLKSPAFDPKNVAVVEQGTAAHYPEGAASVVRVIEYEPSEVKLQVESTEARYLVTSEVNYPGWTASIDGHEAPISMTNVAFRGLPVPAGNHEIVFRFWPRILMWSASMSAIACLVLGWLLFASLWHN